MGCHQADVTEQTARCPACERPPCSEWHFLGSTNWGTVARPAGQLWSVHHLLQSQASGLDQINVAHRPRLLSDNGPSYVLVELAAWLDKQDMPHIRGAPYHPMTQGKIERWHLTLKNRILLENYYLPGQLEARIEAVVAH